MNTQGKQIRQSSKVGTRCSSPTEIELDRIVGIHPDVPRWLISERIFGTNDVAYPTKSAIELFLRNHPIGLTPRNHQGEYFVISGFRSWQILKTAELRQLVGIRRVMANVHPEAIDDRIGKIAISSVLLDLELLSIDGKNAQAQVAEILTQLNDETWGELFGKRDRPKLSHTKAQPTSPEIIQPPRGPGRPRKYPVKDPNAPRKPQGRPRKSPLPNPSEKNEPKLTAPSAPTESPDIEC